MDLDQLVGEAREREPEPMPAPERAVVGAAAAGLLLATFLLGTIAPSDRDADPLVLLLLVLLCAYASRVEFEVGRIFAVPTQLVFIPMLFLAPLQLVPLLVAMSMVIGGLPDFIQRRVHPDRWMRYIADSWFTIGPVLVFIVLDASATPTIDEIWIYAIAAVAQFGSDVAAQCGMQYATSRGNVRDVVVSTFWTARIDFALAPIAYLVSVAAVEHPVLVLGAAPLLWLLQVFSKERTERYAAAIELHQTYRGTVMVLADVVEADDNYTADHCRSVVDLAVATAEQMKLDPREVQELETAALLHDVGKIAIPKEIVNKPARLTDEEFELMKSHTIEGQALLDRVGGKLARVGEIVRSCHERWDGQGYPDGLRGEEIPLAARIVFCCDAYSAMTTDRPYRAAMPPEAAIAELRANAGSQFEPRVVEAVCEVVSHDLANEVPYADAVRAVLASNAPRAAHIEIA